ncbi:MAG: hypothetical protein Crog2KO_06990 [Crocinitomicaceae bacterium]
MLFAGFAANAQCTWSLDGFDSFGDGWNGGSLSITDGGVPVAGSPFAVAGSTQSWSFTVTDGNTIELNWTSGTFDGEVSYNLLDDTGATVYAQGTNPPIGLNYTGTITCTPCSSVPGNLFTSGFTASTADMNWDGVFGATTYDVEWGLTGFIPGTGNELGSVLGTTNTTETATGLSAGVSYDFYVQSDCGNGWSLAFTWSLPCILTTPALMPWIDDFESATTATIIGDAEVECAPEFKWDYLTNDQTAGRVRYGTDAIIAQSGTGAFTLDRSNTSGTSTSQMLLTIDMSNYTATPELALAFDWMHHGEEDQAGDRVWVRGSDVDPWVEVYDFTPITSFATAGDWQEVAVLDILTPLTGAGQTPSASFGVLFGQEDNFPATSTTASDGLTIDNVALFTCLPPLNVAVQSSDTTSASFTWTSGSSEWILEYGSTGFTPGTGDSVITTSNPDTLTGLTPNSFYEVYITSICGPGDTSFATGPIQFHTFDQGLYMEADTECPPAGFIDIAATGVNMNINYNGETTLPTLPFDVLFQGQQITELTVGNNGGLQLGGGAGTNIGAGGNFSTLADGTLFAWGDLLDDETGEVYWQQVGTSPNSVLVFQWDNINNAFGNVNSPTVTFQIQIDEETFEIYYVYDDVVFGGTNVNDDFGANADIGVSGPNQDIATSVNNQTFLQNNSCSHYYYTNCPRPTNLAISGITTNSAIVEWDAGLANETEWLVIYGNEGFDPTQNGTSFNVLNDSTSLIGLDDLTTYDVYIMALCANGDTSFAISGQFVTLPNCADPTNLAGASAIDTLFAAWDYTNNTGFPIQEFAFEYGPTGYMTGMGTQVYGQDTLAPYTDTIADNALMSGGIYDLYVQAVCSPNDTSNWVGPVQITMPLTNDSTCLSQAIPVDGVNYSFNGTGATVQLGELNVAPPAGPCDGQMTWCNSSMTATTWYTFVAPASGNIRIDGEFQDFDGQVAVYETSDCADFNQYNLLGANDDFNLSGDDFPYLNLCGLTPGNTYYMVHDPNGAAGIYSLRLQEIVVEAGTDNGLLDVCLGDTVDLNTQLSNADGGGTWTEAIPTAGFNDPIWASTGLASQVYTFEYTVVDGCAVDSIETTVEVYAPSFAGNDGTINACQNEPVNLLTGLVGSVGVDVTGTWYDPSNNALPNENITAENIPGQYNFDYIAGNGVCPDDTSNVIVIVDPACDYLNLQDLTFEGMDLYPNPTTNVFYISNEGSTEVFNYELTDLNGKVIAAKENAINGVETTEVSVENLETGVYLIHIFNENAEKTFRVVKQ